MNTPRTKQPKRFNPDTWKQEFWRDAGSGDDHYGLCLEEPKAAVEFALLVTEFTHLEHFMEKFAAHVLGTDDDTASHIMRSIISAKARIELLTSALERARRNQNKSIEFDKVIEEFLTLNKIRNDYVHARYVTNAHSGEVKWVTPKSDPLLLNFAAYKPFDLDKMKEYRKRISNLIGKIFQVVADDLNATLPTEQAPLP